jgi:cell division protease FtsH
MDPEPVPNQPRRARSVARRTGAHRWDHRDPRVLAVGGVVLVALIAATVLGLRFGSAPPPQRVALSQALDTIDTGTVVFARIDDARREVLLVTGDPASPPTLTADGKGVIRTPPGEQIVAAFSDGYGPMLAERLREQDVPFTGDPRRAPNLGRDVATRLVPIMVMLALVLWYLGQKGALGPVGRRKDRPAEVPTTRFADVAGADEALAELEEVVSFLHAPERFVAGGATVPRGILLEGPPGTGKTLLARAVAGEAGVPFYSMSGSEFVELFVGVGAARVRRVFATARKHGRAIIFIDEIDAIAKARGGGPSNGSNDEREATLNQLLVEMDGFTASPIILLAATNRADVLDQALLRPGRFDRRIAVPAPDRAGRTRILQLHAAKHRLADDVDLVGLARQTPGMTGADLAALVNGAALQAVRDEVDHIDAHHLEAALATAMLGRERRSAVITSRDRAITAWHEAGHTLAALLQPDADDPVSVTIVPRGAAGGVTWMSGNDHAFLTASEARAKLVTAMAGRAAEELLLDGDHTQGAAGDVASATDIATAMVTQYGMSSLGLARLSPDQLVSGPLAERVHLTINGLLDDALERARALLAEHEPLLRAVAEELLLEETLHLADVLRLQAAGTSVATVAG